MCGFVGFYNLNRHHFAIDEQILTQMHDSIAHRGPDAFGVWKSDEHQLGLAARRLKIIDFSDGANQPMHHASHKVVLCFNGEIYNFNALRKELEDLGYDHQLSSDTEVIINAYKAWGIDGIKRFEGMFAFVLYDLEKRQLYIVRDRIGVKPIYFSLQGNVLSFASEIKALWKQPWMEKKINTRAWYHYLTFMVAPAPLTMFDGVYKLPAGFYMHIDEHKRMRFIEWYSPIISASECEKKLYATESFCIERIQELLNQSVKKRMIADVPVGAYLSGGLDSSLNVALMSQYASQVKTFTIAFDGQDQTNEQPWARKVANMFGTEHHEIVITEKDAFNFYPQMVDYLDEPLADSVCIPFYYVSQCARDNGMKVVQVGEGADELFFGYPAYARYAQAAAMLNSLYDKYIPVTAKKHLAQMAMPFITSQPLRSEFVHNWSLNRPLFWGGAIAFGELQKSGFKKIFTKNSASHDVILDLIYPGIDQSLDSYAIVAYHLERLHQQDPHADFGKQMLYLELKQRLPELLLMRADKMSMAASIEAREPFLDHILIEFMLHVPEALRFKNGVTKYLLKKAAEPVLPHEIIYRDKVGFSAPTYKWFKHGEYFAPYFEKLSQQAGAYRLGFEELYSVDEAVNGNDMHRSVQNWVLQQMLACAHYE